MVDLYMDRIRSEMPKSIVIDIDVPEHYDDMESIISCILCGRDRCDGEVILYSPGRVSLGGVHLECAKDHEHRRKLKNDKANKSSKG